MTLFNVATRVRSRALNAAGVSLLSMGLCAPVLAADPLSNLPFNVAGGAPNLDVRLRYEHVNMDKPLAAPMTFDEADSFTARVRLGYTTAKWNEIDGQLEYEGLTVLGNENFNSTENLRTKYPVVADPAVDELNQAWIRYSGLPKTQIKLGRQRILLDNQRFIGNVGWRQNEMTYDGGLLTTTLIPKTTFNYAYLTNVNSFRFFDFDPTAAVKLDNDLDIKAQLFNAQVAAIGKMLVLTGYAYLLDFDEIPVAPGPATGLFQDTKTLGLRATGAIAVQKFLLSYALEYADQQDYKDAPKTVDADYQLAELSVGYGKLKGTLGYELLSGDGVSAFQTPLATAHAFDGWADQFLVTPLTGLQRSYLTVADSFGKTTVSATFHEFRADKGPIPYGEELDLLSSYALLDNFTLTAKYAAYNANKSPQVAGQPIDTEKLWLYAEYKF